MLKVRFNKRTWLQVDFWQPVNPGNFDEKGNLSLAVLGPISTDLIVDVLFCGHGRRLRSGSGTINYLNDQALYASIQLLRDKLIRRRPDAWVLRNLNVFSQNVSTRLTGGMVPELTFADNLRRIRQVRA